MQSVIGRRPLAVRCESSSFRDQMQSFRKHLVTERRKLESRRLENFSSFSEAVRKMVDHEVEFVKHVADKCKSQCDDLCKTMQPQPQDSNDASPKKTPLTPVTSSDSDLE